MATKKTKQAAPTVGVWIVWIARDRKRVLGQGLDVEKAYADVKARHPNDSEGFPIRIVIDGLPSGMAGAETIRLLAQIFWDSYPEEKREEKIEEVQRAKKGSGG